MQLATTTLPAPRGTVTAPPALATRGLHKSFGRSHVLRGMDLTIPAGVAAAIVGPSGTGKSVLIKHAIGLLQPDAGEVDVLGRSLAGLSRPELMELRRDVGVLFQDGALFNGATLYDNVAFPLRQHTDLGERDIRELVLEALTSVGLRGAADRLPNELSGGMRKRAGLARALVLDPPLLFCDEPDSGLDPVRTALLGELLLDRHHTLGGTLVVVTHNIALVHRIAEHVVLVWRGQVVAQGSPQELLDSEDPFVAQFLAGDAAGPLGMDA